MQCLTCFTYSLISDSGGGGERVLWVALHALFNQSNKFKHIVIYAGDEGHPKETILDHVKVVITP